MTLLIRWAPDIVPAMPEPLKWELPRHMYILDPNGEGPQLSDGCMRCGRLGNSRGTETSGAREG